MRPLPFLAGIIALSMLMTGCAPDLAPNTNRTAAENMCGADVKQCPDGSYVSRDPDNGCEFRPCPSERENGTARPPGAERHECEEDERGVDVCTQFYDPVCGHLADCPPGNCTETYTNPCVACKHDDVRYWTSGECEDG